jgi:hypothetical protein
MVKMFKLVGGGKGEFKGCKAEIVSKYKIAVKENII